MSNLTIGKIANNSMTLVLSSNKTSGNFDFEVTIPLKGYVLEKYAIHKQKQMKDDFKKIKNDIITLGNIIYNNEWKFTHLEEWGLIDEIIKQYPDEDYED
eukprot:SAG22_NODE_230_length_14595_cov_50.767660_10_plen_100_part_00